MLCPGEQAREQHLLEALLLLDVGDAVAFGQLGPLRGRFDGLGQAAELVDQAELLRVLSAPDAAAGDLVHLLARHLAGLPHPGQELLVAVVDPELEGLGDLGTESAIGAEHVGELRGPHSVHMDPQVFRERLLDGGEEPEDPDGAGDRVRVGPDLVRSGRDPITPRGGHAPHRDHHGFARGLGQLQLAADDLGSEGAASGAVHPQHHRLRLLVVSGLADESGGRIASDPARRLGAVQDLALGHHHRHRVAAAGSTRPIAPFGLQVVAEGDPVEGVRLLVLAHEGDEALPDLVARSQPVHQPAVLRHPGGVALGRAQALGEAVGHGGDVVRRELAGGGHVRHVGAPQVAVHVEEGLLGLPRHVVAEVGLHRRLVLADPEDVHLDAQLVESLLVVPAIASEALEQDQAHGVQEDLVRVGREVVLGLAVVVGRCHHLLPGFPEIQDRRPEILELA